MDRYPPLFPTLSVGDELSGVIKKHTASAHGGEMKSAGATNMLGKKISSSGKCDINNKDVLLPNKISSFSQTKEEKRWGEGNTTASGRSHKNQLVNIKFQMPTCAGSVKRTSKNSRWKLRYF